MSKSYKNLNVWKKSMKIAVEIYELIKSNSNIKRDYVLSDQIRRSALSISSNIAEGHERHGDKEFARFLNYSLGSIGELRSQVDLMYRVGLVSKNKYDYFENELLTVSKQTSSLIKYLRRNN